MKGASHRWNARSWANWLRLGRQQAHVASAQLPTCFSEPLGRGAEDYLEHIPILRGCQLPALPRRNYGEVLQDGVNISFFGKLPVHFLGAKADA